LPELITIVEGQVTRRTLDERLFGRTSGLRSSFTKEGVSLGEQPFGTLVFKRITKEGYCHHYTGLLCAEAKIKRPPKIGGGEPATVEEFPFIIAIRYAISKIHFCGGSIISEKYALTAAHCVNGKPLESYYIQAGSTNLSECGVENTVRRTILHPDYDPADNDIAIIEAMFLGRNISSRGNALAFIVEKVGDHLVKTTLSVPDRNRNPDLSILGSQVTQVER
ncbi:unnamed protein product, partial [Timema podura]|nr:unnamed protein product [Timema podura]